MEVESGGKRMIRVIDDGTGMAQDDALLAFERHATSKLRTADDLLSIATLGFRGEARYRRLRRFRDCSCKRARPKKKRELASNLPAASSWASNAGRTSGRERRISAWPIFFYPAYPRGAIS